MNRALTVDPILTGHDLRRLDGKIVLVKSSRDHHKPQAAIRGTIAVHAANDGATASAVRIEFDVPQMFRKVAHHRSITVGPADLRRLLESETEGVFEFTTDEPLD